MLRSMALLLILLLGTACPPRAVDDDDLVGDDDAGDDDAGDDDAGDDDAEADDVGDDDSASPLPADEGTFATTNAAGRAGSWYLPPRDAGDAVPALLLFHATGSNGAGILGSFRDLARDRGVALIAPDSRVSPGGEFTWEVGTAAGEITPDLTHALACLAELEARTDVSLDGAALAAAGHSGGASSAPYLATNDARFDAFGVLHGGVFPSGFGANRPRGWFSTGTDDSLRTPQMLQDALDSVAALGFDDLEFQEFPGGHGTSTTELDAFLVWWLGD